MLEFLPMLKEDRITKEINKLLQKVEKDSKNTEYKQKVIRIYNELNFIYEKAKIDEIIERKHYIENCMDNAYSTFVTLALSTISWYFIEIISEMVNSSIFSGFIISILKILITAILAISAYVYFSAKISKKSRLYLKFNLKNVELESIDLILKHEFEYQKYINDISENYIHNNDTISDEFNASIEEKVAILEDTSSNDLVECGHEELVYDPAKCEQDQTNTPSKNESIGNNDDVEI